MTVAPGFALGFCLRVDPRNLNPRIIRGDQAVASKRNPAFANRRQALKVAALPKHSTFASHPDASQHRDAYAQVRN